jgi:hypothetical protein
VQTCLPSLRGLLLHFCVLPVGHIPSFPLLVASISFAKKKVKKKRIKGSKTNIQEIALNPLEHSQFKIHPQIKTKIPLTTKVITWKLLKNAVNKLIPAKIKYNCAGVQKRLKSIAAIIYYENNIICYA